MHERMISIFMQKPYILATYCFYLAPTIVRLPWTSHNTRRILGAFFYLAIFHEVMISSLVRRHREVFAATASVAIHLSSFSRLHKDFMISLFEPCIAIEKLNHIVVIFQNNSVQ